MTRIAIIGGGISGLSAAYFLNKKRPDLHITLFESTGRLGGAIRTEKIDDCIVEGGPDSFLTQKRAAIRLCEEVGLGDAMVGSNDDRRKTFIFQDGRLHVLPDGFFLMVPTRLSSLVATDLLSWPGKLSALRDLFAFPVEEDVSVGSFIEERFGKEIVDRIAEPMLSGIYGADIGRLSLKSGLPQIWELQKKGSLIRRLVSIRSQKKADGAEPLFTTLRDGMASLCHAIVSRLSNVELRCNAPIEHLDRNQKLWKVGDELYDAVIVATSNVPVVNNEAIRQVRELMNSVRKNSAIVMAFGFQHIEREGFGWLVAPEERRSVLACTYSSNKFSARSPLDRMIVRLFIGGKQADEWINRPDAEIFEEGLGELKRIGKIDQTPIFSRIFRWSKAMPEYQVGHESLVADIEKLQLHESNFFLAGNLFSGVGIPDCIRHAEMVASRVAVLSD